MIRHMFIFGVIIPTLITICVFVAFLFCWFKFNIKDRLLNKNFFKKKKQLQKEGVCQKTPTGKNPASVVYKPDSKDSHGHNGHDPKGKRDSGDPDDPRGGPPTGSLGYCNNAMSHSRPCSGCPEDRDTISQCSIDDSEADLCPAKQGPTVNYFTNPNMVGGGGDPGEMGQRLLGEACGSCRGHGPQGVKKALGGGGGVDTEQEEQEASQDEHLIQQTFHFPVSEANQLHCLALDMTEDDSADDDSNYGHFIPRSEVEGRDLNISDLEKGCKLSMDTVKGVAGSKGGLMKGSPQRGASPGCRYLDLQLKHWQAMRQKKLQSQHAVAGVRYDVSTPLPGYHPLPQPPSSQPCSAESGAAPKLKFVPIEEQRLVI